MEHYFKHVLILLSFHLRLRLYLKYFKSDGIHSIMGCKAVCIEQYCGEDTRLHIRNPLSSFHNIQVVVKIIVSVD